MCVCMCVCKCFISSVLIAVHTFAVNGVERLWTENQEGKKGKKIEKKKIIVNIYILAHLMWMRFKWMAANIECLLKMEAGGFPLCFAGNRIDSCQHKSKRKEREIEKENIKQFIFFHHPESKAVCASNMKLRIIR